MEETRGFDKWDIAKVKVPRSSLQTDGEDVELVDVQDGIVKGRLRGACSGCSMSLMGLKEGMERHIKEAVPEIRKIEGV